MNVSFAVSRSMHAAVFPKDALQEQVVSRSKARASSGRSRETIAGSASSRHVAQEQPLGARSCVASASERGSRKHPPDLLLENRPVA